MLYQTGVIQRLTPPLHPRKLCHLRIAFCRVSFPTVLPRDSICLPPRLPSKVVAVAHGWQRVLQEKLDGLGERAFGGKLPRFLGGAWNMPVRLMAVTPWHEPMRSSLSTAKGLLHYLNSSPAGQRVLPT